MKLSSLDKNALNFLEKYGELLLDYSGQYFRSESARTGEDRKRIERLAKLGYAKIEKVGESTFAVFIKRDVK